MRFNTLKMKNLANIFCVSFSLILLSSCSNDDNLDKDLEKPSINIAYEEGFPRSCSQLIKGQTYSFKALVTDNLALASYSLDIHHNFDHHTHDDQGSACDLASKKQAVNPFVYMENFSIEGGLRSYELHIDVIIPSDIDPGDYHCSFSVTDVTGWQKRTSVDIKIIE